jgi:hypothetical protein
VFAEVGPSLPMRYDLQADQYLMQSYDCNVAAAATGCNIVLHEATLYHGQSKPLIVFADRLSKAA